MIEGDPSTREELAQEIEATADADGTLYCEDFEIGVSGGGTRPVTVSLHLADQGGRFHVTETARANYRKHYDGDDIREAARALFETLGRLHLAVNAESFGERPPSDAPDVRPAVIRWADLAREIDALAD